MSEAEETFAQLTGGLDYPMLIVTTVAGDELAGCLVGFASQCSIDPPRFVVFISNKNHTLRVANRADALAVHIVPETSFDLARVFGSETEDEVDKFSRCRWHVGPGGLPLLDECGRWFAGTILERRPVGDHVGFMLRPFAAGSDRRSDTLSLQRAKELDPGHEA